MDAHDRETLHRIETKLDAVLVALNITIHREALIMSTIDDVLTEVTAQTSLVAGVQTFLKGLEQQIADLKAELDPTQAAKLQSILDGLKANDVALANALGANTAPAPAPAPTT